MLQESCLISVDQVFWNHSEQLCAVSRGNGFFERFVEVGGSREGPALGLFFGQHILDGPGDVMDRTPVSLQFPVHIRGGGLHAAGSAAHSRRGCGRVGSRKVGDLFDKVLARMHEIKCCDPAYSSRARYR